jgi:hypothetical protein
MKRRPHGASLILPPSPLLFGAECVRDYIRFADGKVVTRKILVGPLFGFEVCGECACEYMVSLASGRRFKPYKAACKRPNTHTSLVATSFAWVNAGRTTSHETSEKRFGPRGGVMPPAASGPCPTVFLKLVTLSVRAGGECWRNYMPHKPRVPGSSPGGCDQLTQP